MPYLSETRIQPTHYNDRERNRIHAFIYKSGIKPKHAWVVQDRTHEYLGFSASEPNLKHTHGDVVYIFPVTT